MIDKIEQALMGFDVVDVSEDKGVCLSTCKRYRVLCEVDGVPYTLAANYYCHDDVDDFIAGIVERAVRRFDD